MGEVGAPIARPSFWVYQLLRKVKKFCFMIVLVMVMSSLIMAGSMLGCVPRSYRIFITSLVGTLEFILVTSSDANFVLWLMGMLSRSSIRCIEFLTLKVYGNGVCISMSLERS